MTSDLKDLEETNLMPRHEGSARRIRHGKSMFKVKLAKIHHAPRWLRQLRARKAGRKGSK